MTLHLINDTPFELHVFRPSNVKRLTYQADDVTKHAAKKRKMFPLFTFEILFSFKIKVYNNQIISTVASFGALYHPSQLMRLSFISKFYPFGVQFILYRSDNLSEEDNIIVFLLCS